MPPLFLPPNSCRTMNASLRLSNLNPCRCLPAVIPTMITYSPVRSPRKPISSCPAITIYSPCASIRASRFSPPHLPLRNSPRGVVKGVHCEHPGRARPRDTLQYSQHSHADRFPRWQGNRPPVGVHGCVHPDSVAELRRSVIARVLRG